MIDKISIYVPEYVENTLLRDAQLFEVFKSGSTEINRNRFLSMLTAGYFYKYTDECGRRKKQLEKIVDECLPRSTDGQRKTLCERINSGMLLPELPGRGGAGYKKLSLKPTAMTETVINTVFSELGPEDSLSQYFCRMLMSYCAKPLFERERIIFSENYDFFTQACRDRALVSFSLIWNPGKLYTAVPYEIVTSREEMMNYVLCQTRPAPDGEARASVFRLCRIKSPCMSGRTDTLSDEVADRLERMKKYAPQYMINSDEEICVRLTDSGEILYSRIYYSRPQYERIEHREDGHYYYFRCSDEQVFFYFQRFGWGSAEIISPEYLRDKMADFHTSALEPYIPDSGDS